MRKITITLIAVLACMATIAQQEYTYTFFGDNNNFYNPAAAGTKDYISVTGLFRKQWVGFDGSPTSGGVTFDMPFKRKNMGIGGMVYQDHIGVTNQTNIAGMYSYHLKINREHRLAFGINAGIDIVNTKFDRLAYWDAGDNTLADDYVNVMVPHFGVGVYYFFDKFYAGISIPRMISMNSDQFNSVNFSDAPSLVTHYYFTSGYQFKLNNKYSLKPSLLLKYTNNVKPQLDISVAMYYDNKVGAGIAYKSLGFLSLFMKYNIKDAFVLGYGFDFSMNPLQQYSNGSHELMLQYRIPAKRGGGNARLD